MEVRDEARKRAGKSTSRKREYGRLPAKKRSGRAYAGDKQKISIFNAIDRETKGAKYAIAKTERMGGDSVQPSLFPW